MKKNIYLVCKKINNNLKLRFLCIFKFMADSIDSLPSNLKKEQIRETAN